MVKGIVKLKTWLKNTGSYTWVEHPVIIVYSFTNVINNLIAFPGDPFWFYSDMVGYTHLENL